MPLCMHANEREREKRRRLTHEDYRCDARMLHWHKYREPYQCIAILMLKMLFSDSNLTSNLQHYVPLRLMISMRNMQAKTHLHQRGGVARVSSLRRNIQTLAASKGFGATKKAPTANIDVNAPCPCSSGSSYLTCCSKFHSNEELPSTPEQLLRSRYVAYKVRCSQSTPVNNLCHLLLPLWRLHNIHPLLHRPGDLLEFRNDHDRLDQSIDSLTRG